MECIGCYKDIKDGELYVMTAEGPICGPCDVNTRSEYDMKEEGDK